MVRRCRYRHNRKPRHRPSKPMCSRNLRLSHYRSRLIPRHRNRLTHNLNRDTWLPPGSKYEPITTGGYIGIFLLMLLPLINLILLIIWACGGCQKVNKANFARAMLIMMIIGSVLSLLMFFAVRMLFGSEIDSLMEAFGDLLK